MSDAPVESDGRDPARDPDDDVVFARTVAGGFAGAIRAACEVAADGSYRCTRAGADDVVGHLTPDQVDLLHAVCRASDFHDLPPFVDGPVTRSEAYTWTYRVAGHDVKMRDPDRAGDAVPAALRVLDALADALETGLRNDDGEGGAP